MTPLNVATVWPRHSQELFANPKWVAEEKAIGKEYKRVQVISANMRQQSSSMPNASKILCVAINTSAQRDSDKPPVFAINERGASVDAT